MTVLQIKKYLPAIQLTCLSHLLMRRTIPVLNQNQYITHLRTHLSQVICFLISKKTCRNSNMLKSYSISFIQSCYVSKLRFRDESTRRLWALHIYVVPITYWAAYEWLLCILLQQYCKARSYWTDSLGGLVFLQL